jgi:hypothetical protein
MRRAANRCRRGTRARRRCRARRTPPPKTRCPSGYRTKSPAYAQSRAKKSSLGAGSTRNKTSGAERRNAITLCGSLVRETGNAGEARACISNGRIKSFYHSYLSSCGRHAKRAGCERARLRNMCLGHVLIAVRQGCQRRDASAAGEEQLGRCAAGWFYPSLMTSSSRWLIASRRSRRR